MNSTKFDEAERLEFEGKREEAFAAYTDFIHHQHRNLQTADFSSEFKREKLALAYNNRGLLLYLKVEFKLAIEDYTKALDLNPSLTVAHYNRGLIHYRLSRFGEAVEDMQKVLALEPDFISAQQCLQQSLKDLERTKQ